MKNKLISVIIPTYGRSNYLIRTVNSVLKQTYTEFEIIIIDDNGRGTKQQVDTFNQISDLLTSTDKITYITHEHNMNGSVARNTGIKYAKGEFLCFLDDDDEFLEDKLFKQFRLLQNRSEDWIACYTGHIRYFDDNKQENYSYRPILYGDILFDVLNFSVDACSGSSLMVRKDIIDTIGGFNENLQRHQDYEFLAKIAAYGKIAVISDPMVIIHVHKESYRQKEYKDIEKTRLDYIKYTQPYFEKLSVQQQKQVKFTNNFWLLKRSLIYRKHFKIIKYFFLCKKPLHTIQELLRDSIKYIKRKK